MSITSSNVHLSICFKFNLVGELMNKHNDNIILVCQDHIFPVREKFHLISNNQQYIVWVKIINFSFMPKIIRILRSCSMKIFPTVNISKLNY